jgi:ElaB/YqjD/DUF883 family membrane-anchored ribosome-binding protein
VITKEAYQKKVEVQLKTWCAEVEKMLAEASRTQAEVEIEHLEVLAAKQGAAQQKLQELKQADTESWEMLKVNLEKVLTELRHEFDQGRVAHFQAGIKSIGWAEGIAKEQAVKSIGWAEGIAKENPLESIGWAEGVAKENPLESIGWAEGYAQERL